MTIATPMILTALLLLPGALSLPASSLTNTTATAPCVSHVPQTAVDTDLIITVWDEIDCQGLAGASYTTVYERNSYQNTSFRSYTLSRTHCPHPISPHIAFGLLKYAALGEIRLVAHCCRYIPYIALSDSKFIADSHIFRHAALKRKDRLQ